MLKVAIDLFFHPAFKNFNSFKKPNPVQLAHGAIKVSMGAMDLSIAIKKLWEKIAFHKHFKKVFSRGIVCLGYTSQNLLVVSAFILSNL